MRRKIFAVAAPIVENVGEAVTDGPRRGQRTRVVVVGEHGAAMAGDGIDVLRGGDLM
ncbi:MAG: hypothetical protein ACTHU0_32140 [Kofleriaceae bacterium]